MNEEIDREILGTQGLLEHQELIGTKRHRTRYPDLQTSGVLGIHLRD